MSTTFVRRSGTDFLNYARRVVEIVCSETFGVDQAIFLNKYFDGNPPSTKAQRDFEWEEFKRARDHSNTEFDKKHESWVWMRARRGLLPGQFYYQAVARIVKGEPEMMIEYPVSESLYLDKTGEWHTRTRSEMRVRVANIDAKRRLGLEKGDNRLISEAEKELDEIVVIAPRLAKINFDLGLTVQDLRELARSANVPLLLQKQVKRTLASYEKAQEDIKKLSQVVYKVMQLRGKS